MKAWMHRALLTFGSLLFVLITCSSVQAITIDDFTQGSQSLEAVAGGQVFSVVPTSTAVGGFRKLTVINHEAVGASVGKVSGRMFLPSSPGDPGLYAHGQEPQVNGTTILRWDGTNVSTNEVFPSGSIDLTHDGSTAFILHLLSADHAGGVIEITIVDATDPSKTSSVSKTLPQFFPTPSVPTSDFEIPFADFVGTASFTTVGAITLVVDGSSVTGLDMELQKFITNGCTERVPTHNMNVYDDCGVCEGGNADKDICNVCFGDGTSCLDCAGTPFGNATKDVCGICNGNGTSCLDCAGTPFGSATLDPCGVCAGDGSSCADCLNVPNGTALLDQCGVCAGDGTSCLDCTGTPNGNTVFDQCGVCGGDGKSCVDCKGDVFGSATIDRCGICDGDGQSCLECTGYDIFETQHELDGFAKQQEKIIIRLGANLKRINKRKKLRQFVNEHLSRAHVLQISNWTLSWTLPSVFSVCENSTFCASSSNESVLEQYRSQSLELLNISNSLVNKTKKIRGIGARERRFQKRASILHKKSIELSNTVPPISSNCS